MRIPRGAGLALLGAGYGVGLGGLALVSAGAGHGTYVPVALSSAPAGLLGIPAALLGAPLLWAAMGYTLARASSRGPQRAFLALAVGHYLGGAGLLLTPTYGDWGYLPRVLEAMPWVVPSWVIVYLGGQAFMWLTYRRRVRGAAAGAGGRPGP